MQKIRIAICDDDSGSAEVINGVVSSAFRKAGVPVETETYTAVDSLNRRISAQVYDLLFLDICMPKCDGIAFGEMLRKSGNTTDIIYVSNREDKVFEALKIQPFAFVRKNNFLGDITLAVNNYISRLTSRDAFCITIQGKSGIVTVKIAETVYFEGMGKYQLMHVTGRSDSIPVYRTMEKLEEELDKYGFIRIHKGMLVNYCFISRILAGEVELTTGESLPLSRRKSKDIKAKYLSLLKGYGNLII